MNKPHRLVELTRQHTPVAGQVQNFVEVWPRTTDADGSAVWRMSGVRAIAALATARTMVAVGVAVAAAVLLAGCSRDVAGVAVPTSSPASTTTPPSVAVPTSAAVPAPAAAPTPVAVPAPVAPATTETEVVLVDADVFGDASGSGAWFTTPSGNIRCNMAPAGAWEGIEGVSDSSGYEKSVRCDVPENTWSLPPRPSDCESDFGISVHLVGTGMGELGCVSDTATIADSAILGYGQAVEFDGMTCESRRIGLHCRNNATGHGFTVSRASYTLS